MPTLDCVLTSWVDPRSVPAAWIWWLSIRQALYGTVFLANPCPVRIIPLCGLHTETYVLSIGITSGIQIMFLCS